LIAYLNFIKPLINRLSFIKEGLYNEAVKDKLEKLNIKRVKVNIEKSYPDI
jgi:hypothetical protein